MKKATALFLLILMTLAAVQPVLALHFCGGRFHSVAVGAPQKSCCGKAMDNHLKTLPKPAETPLFQPVNTCCSTYIIEISTDDFQSLEQQSIIDFQQLTFNPVLFPNESLSKEINPDASLSLEPFFPPGGLARSHVDWLTFICIFRI